MKILVVGDIHFCTYGSIVRSRSERYSTRLENLIKSINWAEKQAEMNSCDSIVYLGDFFDGPDLTAEELTALSKITWTDNIERYFLVGNHEVIRSDLSQSSAHLFNLSSLGTVIDKPLIIRCSDFEELAFLPYCLEADRKPISEIFEKPFMNSHRVLFSHNDIKGIQMGSFLSTAGYDIEDIENNCTICFNGHIHNNGDISTKIINVGNLTGQNFSEDAYKYSHKIYLIDTKTREINDFENPEALNFYKIDTTTANFDPNTLKDNAVISLKCYFSETSKFKELLDNDPKIIASRIITCPDESQTKSAINQININVDHLKQFNDYILENLGTSEIIKEELQEICK